MHVFHIKGFSGILMFLVAVVTTVLVAFALPSTFLMVLWNAIILEGFGGPEINLYQGFILWLAVLVLFKIIFKPEIQLQFRNVADDLEALKTGKPDKKEE